MTFIRLRSSLVGCLLLSSLIFVNARPRPLVSPKAAPFETRCGWFQNPTPANIWLNDRDGEWILGVQGGYQVESDWEWPAFKKGQWVETNGHYGYGCACLRMRVDRESGHVLEVKSSTARPLSVCRKDRSLKRLE